MAKGKLPEGYRGVDLIIKEFRTKNPKGKVETTPILLGDGFVIITAKITTDDGAVGSGMADADINVDKSVEKAESGAIRRAMLTLGYESIEKDDKEEVKEEKRSFKREEPKKEVEKAKVEDSEDDEEQDEKEEKPKSRFGNKSSEKEVSKKASTEDEEESSEEGKAKFKRGSRFQRD